jgi:hypothetical protein
MTSWRRFHHFDPYEPEKERRSEARAKETKWAREQLKSGVFAHKDPEVEQRRYVRANQTVRAKSRPVSLPKIW